MQVKKFRRKGNETRLKKYGNKNWNNLEKAKKTRLERYGVEHSLQNLAIKEKHKQTCLNKYGSEYIFQVKKFRNKGTETIFKKYGGYGYQSNILTEKINNTRLKNYHKKFLELSNKIHKNKYKYNKLKNSHDEIEIICPKHGMFKQLMYTHVNGSGCPKCAIIHSKSAIEWLNYISETESIHIQHAMNKGEYRIPGTKYHVDGYCKETNTCYEFLGDFWHGNPEIYNYNDINPKTLSAFGKCYDNSINRLNEIKDLGYNLEYIWESDWNKMND